MASPCFFFYGGAEMLLSCPAKKVTKECGIGEALRLGAPARRAALPYVPHPARTYDGSEHLNLHPVHSKNVPIFAVQG